MNAHQETLEKILFVLKEIKKEIPAISHAQCSHSWKPNGLVGRLYGDDVCIKCGKIDWNTP